VLLLKDDPVRPALTAATGLACLFALVLISRLPFLDAGYGLNIDAWRVARVARDLAITGQYSVSRFPGYPLQEIVCALFWRGGPSALNGLSALFSAITATTFAAILRKLGCRDWFLAGLALAATPIFYVSSVCSKDYIWALAFVLLSLLCALNRRAGIAGALLGVATGCRITSAAMILPIALILFNETQRSWRAIAKLLMAAAGIALLAFFPVWSRYGTDFLTFYGDHARPDWRTILSRATLQVWGSIGLVGLGIAALSACVARKRIWPASWWIVVSLVLVFVIYTVAYLRLPDQAGYLLPIVPAVLLLACLFTPRRALQIALICLLLASLLDLTPKGPHPGAILTDHNERLQNLINMRKFLEFTESAPGNSVFVVGDSEPEIAVLTPHLVNGRNRYVYLMNAFEAKTALHSGRALYYLPSMRKFNYEVTGTDLAQYGARDLQSLFNQRKVAVHTD
jgi:hypothetical protein